MWVSRFHVPRGKPIEIAGGELMRLGVGGRLGDKPGEQLSFDLEQYGGVEGLDILGMGDAPRDLGAITVRPCALKLVFAQKRILRQFTRLDRVHDGQAMTFCIRYLVMPSGKPEISANEA